MTLIDRLSKLDGPDREVDAMLYCFQHGHQYSRKYGNDYAMWVEGVPHEVKIIDRHLDKFTSRIDDAFSLAKKLLPKMSISFSDEDGVCTARIGCFERIQASTPAIALCIAILRAKEASNAE